LSSTRFREWIKWLAVAVTGGIIGNRADDAFVKLIEKITESSQEGKEQSIESSDSLRATISSPSDSLNLLTPPFPTGFDSTEIPRSFLQEAAPDRNPSSQEPNSSEVDDALAPQSTNIQPLPSFNVTPKSTTQSSKVVDDYLSFVPIPMFISEDLLRHEKVKDNSLFDFITMFTGVESVELEDEFLDEVDKEVGDTGTDDTEFDSDPDPDIDV
jgi:hypothetical protein